MAFNINNFRAELSRSGISKTSLYEVFIFGPSNISNFDVERGVSLRAIQTDLPNRAIQTIDYKISGPGYKIGYDSLFSELNMSLILSEDHKEKIYMEEWQDLIVGSYRTGEISQQMFEIGFYDDYKGKIIIRNFNDVGDIVSEIELIDCYPSAIGNISLSWQSTEIALLPVTFTYRYIKNVI